MYNQDKKSRQKGFNIGSMAYYNVRYKYQKPAGWIADGLGLFAQILNIRSVT